MNYQSILAGLAVFTGAMAIGPWALSDPVPGSGGTIENRLCTVYQACNEVPKCPAASCNHCNHLTNTHLRCLTELEEMTCEYWIDSNECGVKINGICDANDNCITVPTTDPCPREVCESPAR